MGSSCCKRAGSRNAFPALDSDGKHDGKASPNFSAVFHIGTPSLEDTSRNHSQGQSWERVTCRDEVQKFIKTNREITRCTREGQFALGELLRRMCRERRSLNGVNIATVFHSSSKTPHILTSEILNYLADEFEYTDLTGQMLGNICYGLQGMEGSLAVTRILSLLTSKMQRDILEITPQQIGNTLYGLQKLRNSAVLHSFLGNLLEQMNSCKEVFSKQAIGNSCFGLQSLRNSNEVLGILDFIAGKAEELITRKMSPPAILESQAIANSLYGLQNIGDCPELRRLVLALVTHLENLDKVAQPFSAQEVAMAFYGLRSLDGSSVEVRRLLAGLSTQLKTCRGSFRMRHIASCFVGLRWLGDSPELREILSIMAVKVGECQEQFDSQALSNCLYGLQKLSCIEEVNALLETLLPKFKQVKTPLRAIEIGNALFGLQSLGDSKTVRKLLEDLSTRIESCQNLDAQAICNSLYGLRKLANIEECRCAILALLPKIEAYEGSMEPRSVACCFSLLQAIDESFPASVVLRSLRHLLILCDKPFRAEHLASILSSLESLGDSPALRDVLRLLRCKIETRVNSFRSGALASTFLWLHSVGNSEEVRDMLRVLTPCIKECKHMDAGQICTCLEASSLLDSHDYEKDLSMLLEVLAERLLESKVVVSSAVCLRAKHYLDELGEVQGAKAVANALHVKTQ